MSIFVGTASDAANHMAGQIKKALSVLPDPTVTDPCQAQATFMCTGQAAGERLNPLAMLPGSRVPNGYVPMCQPCYDHLADSYVAQVHA
jgi:hypothetical protein